MYAFSLLFFNVLLRVKLGNELGLVGFSSCIVSLLGERPRITPSRPEPSSLTC